MTLYIKWYLIAVNLLTFLLFGIDKRKAIKKKNRIPEFRLFFFSFIGGSAGGLLAMALFRHKTRKKSFTIGLHVMLVFHIILTLYMHKWGVI